jgi:hypothetical protein
MSGSLASVSRSASRTSRWSSTSKTVIVTRCLSYRHFDGGRKVNRGIIASLAKQIKRAVDV